MEIKELKSLLQEYDSIKVILEKLKIYVDKNDDEDYFLCKWDGSTTTPYSYTQIKEEYAKEALMKTHSYYNNRLKELQEKIDKL